MVDRSKRRPLFIAPSGMNVGTTPNGTVSLDLGEPHPSLGFSPGLTLAVELTPAEALDLATKLEGAARAAEGGPPEPQ